jgi:hypothetical protein
MRGRMGDYESMPIKEGAGVHHCRRPTDCCLWDVGGVWPYLVVVSSLPESSRFPEVCVSSDDVTVLCGHMAYLQRRFHATYG